MLATSKKRETIKVATLLALFGLLCCFFIYQSKGLNATKVQSASFEIAH
jgi:hypothetical protein